MTTKLHCITLVITTALMAGCATCGPGTVETDGAGWRFERDDSFWGGAFENKFNKVCVPVGTVSDCTTYQMIEEDGGAWRIDRDGAGWRIDRDGAGWRRERDDPHHPGDEGDITLGSIFYVPTGVCRIGVPPL